MSLYYAQTTGKSKGNRLTLGRAMSWRRWRPVLGGGGDLAARTVMVFTGGMVLPLMLGMRTFVENSALLRSE